MKEEEEKNIVEGKRHSRPKSTKPNNALTLQTNQ